MRISRSYFRWGVICLLVLLANLPWLIWWRFTSQTSGPDYGYASLFFLLAIIITTGLVVGVALVVRGVVKRRWGLLAILFAINIYWGTKWIEIARLSTGEDVGYQWARIVLLALAVVTSLMAIFAYWLITRLVKAMRRKSSSHPVSPRPCTPPTLDEG